MSDSGAAQVAAKWWADQLRYGAKIDNGDKSYTGAMTMVLAKMSQRSFSEEDCGLFEDALKSLIEKNGINSLRVDYHPDRSLEEAARIAGISLGMSDLPWKTHMDIIDGVVCVACGYGQPYEQIN